MSEPSRSKRILLVDDDPDFVEMNRAVLADGGYAVVAAYSGPQCLKVAAAEKPDLIILDMVMEGRTAGSDVARALRGAEPTRSIPLIMITSVHESVPVHLEPDPVWLPVDLFLEKPVDPALLLETVAGILGPGRRA
jgi:two-component system, OmpR family, alkaline phosphatase synthesis response regulator PhoP